MDFDIHANLDVEDIDAVPETYRPLYGEAENGYSVQAPFRPIAEALSGLNGALVKARAEAKHAKKSANLQPWLELGESPDAVRDEMENLREQLKSATKGKVNLDKMHAEFEQAKQAAIGEKQKELETMHNSLAEHLIDREVAFAMSKPGLKGSPKLLLPHVRRSTQVVNDGGQFVARVVDAQGDPRGDGKGGFMSVEALVKECRADAELARCFDADDVAGAGIAGTQNQTVRPNGTGYQGDKPTQQKITDGLAARGIGR